MARYVCKRLVKDLDGDAIADANVNVYLEGTNTPAKVYLIGSGGSAVNTLPQTTTNDNGIFEFWVDNSDYTYRQRFRIEIVKGTARYTVTNVQIVKAGTPVSEVMQEPTVINVAEDAGLLDGYDTSTTPAASKIPVSDSNGLLNAWINAVTLGGSGTSTTIAFRVMSGDYGATWGNLTLPTVAGPTVVVAVNTNETGAGARLYVYVVNAWRYVELTTVS